MSNSKSILESSIELATGKAIPDALNDKSDFANVRRAGMGIPEPQGSKLELGERPHAIQFEFVVLGLNNFLAQHILDFIVGLVSKMGLTMAGGFHQITEAEMNAVEEEQ